MKADTCHATVDRLLRFAQRNTKLPAPLSSAERRSDQMEMLTVPSVALPVNAKLFPSGAPLVVVTQNISAANLELIFESRPQHQLYVIRFSVADQTICLLGLVAWCQAIDTFEGVGMEVLKRLDESLLSVRICELPKSVLNNIGFATFLGDRFCFNGDLTWRPVGEDQQHLADKLNHITHAAQRGYCKSTENLGQRLFRDVVLLKQGRDPVLIPTTMQPHFVE